MPLIRYKTEKIRIFGESPYSADTWKEFRAAGKLLHAGHIVVGPTLPGKPGLLMAFADVIDSHAHAEYDGVPPSGERMLSISLTLRPRPPSKPPNDVVKISKRAGTQRQFRKRLFALGLRDCVYSLEFSVNEADARCTVMPIATDATNVATKHLGGGSSIESVGYRFSEPVEGLEELTITYMHRRRRFDVMARATGPFSLTENLEAPFATGILQRILTNAFERTAHE